MLALKSDFLLDPAVIFLNHGSFGAVPRPVFHEYQRWQRELERQPVEFLNRRASSLLEDSRRALAAFIGTDPANLVYTTNVTEAVNIVARSLRLGPEDEVLATDMEYGAMDRTWTFLSLRTGFKYINHPITIPVGQPSEFVNNLWDAVTPRTKVIFISHISSPTALIMPVKDICQRARQAGILTVIDGAHAPGQIDLNLTELGADFYAANLHKWLCAPKGAGFLYAHPEVQHMIEPLIISWGWQSENPGPSQFIDYLQYTGTRDLSTYLSVPSAIKYQAEHDWNQVRNLCHNLAADVLETILNRSNTTAFYHPSTSWFAQMVACPLPNSVDIVRLKSDLYDQFRIEVPVLQWNKHKLIRVSFQGYNEESDLDSLIMALDKLVYSA